MVITKRALLMLLTAWCNQLRWHQCSSGLPAIIPLTTRYWNRPVGGDDGRDCVSRSNRKWQLKSCRLIAIGPQKRLAALMVKRSATRHYLPRPKARSIRESVARQPDRRSTAE